MTTLLPNIKSNDWQISTAGFGAIAEGLQDIRQCLDILLRTSKGSDPLRAEFGSDIYQYIDQPNNVAIPNITKAIIEAVSIWETRVRLVTVQSSVNKENLKFFVTYQLVDQELIDQLTLFIKGGFISLVDAAEGAIILEAVFPTTTNTLTVNFIGDGKQAAPPPPPGGFGSRSDLFYWVQVNWGFYGTWYMGADRIVLYLKPGIFSTVSLSITASTVRRFLSIIPVFDFGASYTVKFTPDAGSVIAEADIDTLDQMLAYAQVNLSSYGKWQIESVGPAVPGDFLSSDFSETDFLTGSSGYALVLYSSTQINPTLEILI